MSVSTDKVAPKHWPDRRGLTERFGCSRSTIRRRERSGELVGLHDVDGIVRFDPAQLTPTTLAANLVASEPSVGDRVAAVVAMLRHGSTVVDAVETLHEPFDFVTDVRDDLVAEEDSFVVSAPARARMEATVRLHVGPYTLPDESVLAELIDELAPLRSQVAALGQQVRSLRADLDSAEDEIGALGETQALRETRVAALERDLELVTTARDLYLNQLRDALAQIDVLRGIGRDVAAERDAALDEVEALQAALAEAEAENAALRAQARPDSEPGSSRIPLVSGEGAVGHAAGSAGGHGPGQTRGHNCE